MTEAHDLDVPTEAHDLDAGQAMTGDLLPSMPAPEDITAQATAAVIRATDSVLGALAAGQAPGDALTGLLGSVLGAMSTDPAALAGAATMAGGLVDGLLDAAAADQSVTLNPQQAAELADLAAFGTFARDELWPLLPPVVSFVARLNELGDQFTPANLLSLLRSDRG